MVGDVETARRLSVLDPASEALLVGPRRPVVLAPRTRRRRSPRPSRPGNPDLGVLLAYTPLHALLLGLPGDAPGPQVLVMTSGNLGGEPIAYDDEDALERLAPLADGWLRHDRPIRVPCDDSVVRVVDGEELPVRRSRGYAPLPVALPVEVPATLAVGADLKNTCCGGARALRLAEPARRRHGRPRHPAGVRRDGRAPVRAHAGRARAVVAADAHPGYRSTAVGAQHAPGRAGCARCSTTTRTSPR